MANNYSINYDDKRFAQVEADKKEALSDIEQTYGGMINNSDKYYQAQINASKQWADKQTQLQQQNTDFAIEQIEQQKDQAHTDYLKEQSGSYVDWQKQSNQYGANAESIAAGGLANTGFAESSQVSMYNTYQNRVAAARESYNRAVLNYDNAIKDAQLQNNSALAEIAFKALEQQLQLSLEGFQYKNNLILEQANKKTEIDNTYHARYQDVLNQINTENALAEEVRQYNETMAENKRQFNKEMDLKNKEYEEGIRQFNAEIARLKAKDAQEYKLEIQQLELQKSQLEEEKRQFNAQMAEEKRQFNATQAKKSSSSGSSSSSSKKSSSGSSKSSGSSSIKKTSTSSTKKKSSSSPTIDMQSVLALGYGPISAAKLSSLVDQGVIEQYTKNGKIKFRKKNKSGGVSTKKNSLRLSLK